MQKRTFRLGKKRALITSSLLVILFVAGLVYWYYMVDRNDSSVTKSEAQEQVEELNLIGDKDIAAAYIEAINADKPDEAAQLFTDRINAETDPAEKLLLLQQQFNLALIYNLNDQALLVAKQMEEIRPAHLSADYIARAYAAKGDYGQAAEYSEKALAATENIEDNAQREVLREAYQMNVEIYTSKIGTPSSSDPAEDPRNEK